MKNIMRTQLRKIPEDPDDRRRVAPLTNGPKEGHIKDHLHQSETVMKALMKKSIK